MVVEGPNGVFWVMSNYDGYWVAAAGQNVGINGSPLIVTFDPPIAPTVNAGTIYQAILALLH